MPCYTVETVEISFKAENIDLLKKTIETMGIKIQSSAKTRISFYNVGRLVTIDVERQSIEGSGMNEKQLTSISNQIKRAYSEQVIDEIAKKQKWLKKKMGENRYQLQRF